MTNSSPALAPDYPDTANRATEMGWAQGVMNDGRPWLASLWEDEDGDRTLALLFGAEEDAALDEEAVIQMLVAEGLVVPVESEIDFFICEQRDDLFSPTPLWMVEVLLSDAEREWARPGFTVQALSEYRVY
jgi:hypothetical protein